MRHAAPLSDQDIVRSEPSHALHVELAATRADVEASMRLRYQVFAEEMGAQVEGADEGLDRDYYDAFCHHLLVRDSVTGQVVGSTRILTDQQAGAAGGFYSQGEFDLTAIRALPGRIMEIGRTCIHPDYRTGGAITILWAGMARFMAIHRFDYLMGCASIGMADGGAEAHAIMARLREKHLSAPELRVTPRLALPPVNRVSDTANMPPLLKAYLRIGARICGEACWDPDFKVADVFILLNMDHIPARYQRHFLDRSWPAQGGRGHEVLESHV